jgi:hypothetical protein
MFAEYPTMSESAPVNFNLTTYTAPAKIYYTQRVITEWDTAQ